MLRRLMDVVTTLKRRPVPAGKKEDNDLYTLTDKAIRAKFSSNKNTSHTKS